MRARAPQRWPVEKSGVELRGRRGRSSRLPGLAVALALVILLIVGQLVGTWFGMVDFAPKSGNATHIALLVFVLAAAIPFVPGAEIGLALLMVFGREAVLEVYLSMLIALMLAFLIGRLAPSGFVARFMIRIESRQRLMRMRSRRVRGWSSSQVLRIVLEALAANRHLALGALLNMPGNSILGGGGGIAMLAGASRQYSVLGFALTIALAVLPIPIVFYFLG